MDNFPLVPVINMADYPVDSDEEDISIKDSTGKTVAVVVESKMRRLSLRRKRVVPSHLFLFSTPTTYATTTWTNTFPSWTGKEK